MMTTSYLTIDRETTHSTIEVRNGKIRDSHWWQVAAADCKQEQKTRHAHGVITVTRQEERSAIHQEPWAFSRHRSDAKSCVHCVLDSAWPTAKSDARCVEDGCFWIPQHCLQDRAVASDHRGTRGWYCAARHDRTVSVGDIDCDFGGGRRDTSDIDSNGDCCGLALVSFHSHLLVCDVRDSIYPGLPSALDGHV